MKVTKKAGDFNTYSLEVSFGELKAIEFGLQAGPKTPEIDEMTSAIAWYLDNEVPGPGEDKEEFKKRKEGQANFTTAEEPLGDKGELDADKILPEPPAE